MFCIIQERFTVLCVQLRPSFAYKVEWEKRESSVADTLTNAANPHEWRKLILHIYIAAIHLRRKVRKCGIFRPRSDDITRLTWMGFHVATGSSSYVMTVIGGFSDCRAPSAVQSVVYIIQHNG